MMLILDEPLNRVKTAWRLPEDQRKAGWRRYHQVEKPRRLESVVLAIDSRGMPLAMAKFYDYPMKTDCALRVRGPLMEWADFGDAGRALGCGCERRSTALEVALSNMGYHLEGRIDGCGREAVYHALFAVARHDHKVRKCTMLDIRAR